jgi:two-component system sensor kinase FixL
MPAMFSHETQALMEAAVDAIVVIDHRGQMTAVNRAAQQLFGYRDVEMLGRNVSMLMPEPHRGAHDDYLRHHLDSGEQKVIGVGREVQCQRKDGSLCPVRLSVGRVPDSSPPRFVGLLRDISAEHAGTAALKLERDRANAYLELNDAILMRLDTEYRVCEINARGSELLGAPTEVILGSNWLDLARDESERERARVLLERALASTASRERESDAVDFAGEPRRICWRCIALRAADGTPGGWLVSGADVTERARREENAVLAQERFTRVARLASMGEMASGVAHELNQPLTAITTYARACERYLAMPQPDFAELKDALREIGAEGLRAGRIIGRLRQLVRGDEPAALAPVDLNAVVEDLRPLLAADARVFDTRLEIHAAADLPRVMSDPVQLQQVILNLVRNAFEAMVDTRPPDRVVGLTTTRVPGGEVELEICDSGPGFPAEIVSRLFHPFATTKKAGTGLGLAMCRTLVQSMGGNIGIRAATRPGACVFVRLPPVEDAA